LKLLHFLIYENDIAGFGSDTALIAIDNITGRVNIEFRGLALTHCSNSATPLSLWPVYSKKIFMSGIFKMMVDEIMVYNSGYLEVEFRR